MTTVLTTMGLLVVVIGGCSEQAPAALGTLEWDRITLPAPESEPIVAIHASEGQAVEAGVALMSLDRARSEARLASANAEVLRGQRNLDELRAGPRREDREQAAARLRAAKSTAAELRLQLKRVRNLVQQQAMASSSLDAAEAESAAADARVAEAQAVVDAMKAGTRPEDIAQAEAALAAAKANARVQAVNETRIEVRAPRDGRIDSIPFKVGDQPPAGAPLLILLVGGTPYARVYVPEPLRADVRAGTPAHVFVDGHEQPFPGQVRMIRNEPTFTPYYALHGDDASRLSYLAEIELGPEAASLPAGIPVRVEFETTAEP